MSKTVKNERTRAKTARSIRNKIKRDKRKRTKAQVERLARLYEQEKDAVTLARKRKLTRIGERVQNKLCALSD
jgi:hypothetical protein